MIPSAHMLRFKVTGPGNKGDVQSAVMTAIAGGDWEFSGDELVFTDDDMVAYDMIVYDDYGNNYQNYNWHNFNDGWDGWHRKHHNSMKIVSMSMKMTQKNVELELLANDYVLNLNAASIQVP